MLQYIEQTYKLEISTFVSSTILECRSQTTSVALPRSSTVESSWRPLALKSTFLVGCEVGMLGAVADVVVDIDVMVADKVVDDMTGVNDDAVAGVKAEDLVWVIQWMTRL